MRVGGLNPEEAVVVAAASYGFVRTAGGGREST